MAWDLEREIIKAGYRHLAKGMHPDHGGTNPGMADLNVARQRLDFVCEKVMDQLFPAQPLPDSTVFQPFRNAAPAPRRRNTDQRNPPHSVGVDLWAAIDGFIEAFMRDKKARKGATKPKRKR
jgi:hypothetical protein